MTIRSLIHTNLAWTAIRAVLVVCLSHEAMAELALSPNRAVVSSDSRQRLGIVVTADQPWSWTSHSDWIESTDEDDSKVFWYSVLENPGTDARTGTIEFRCGTHIRFFTVTQTAPRSRFDVSRISLSSDGLFTIRWSSEKAEKFAVEVSDFPSGGAWRALRKAPIIASGQETSFTIPRAPAEKERWYRVRKGFPNLVPEAITVNQTTAKPGDTLTVTWRVANPGNADAVASSTRVQLNQSSTGPGGYELGNIEAAPVAAGGVLEQTLQFTIPEVAASGRHYVWVNVDRTNLLSQSEDDDIQRSSAIIVE